MSEGLGYIPPEYDEDKEPEERNTPEYKFSREMLQTMHWKKHHLIRSDRWAYRFMSIDEYEKIMDGSKELSGEANVSNHLPGFFESVRSDSYEPMTDGEKWENEVLRETSGWGGTSLARSQKESLRGYMDSVRETRKSGENVEKAKSEFIDSLKDKLGQKILMLYGKYYEQIPFGRWHNPGSELDSDEEKLDPVMLLDRENPRLTNESRRRLKELIQKDNGEFTDNDIRNLLSYANEAHDVTESSDYQVLAVWPIEKFNIGYENSRLVWVRMDGGKVTANDILAAMPIVDNKALIGRISRAMVSAAEGDSQAAHIIYNIRGYEVLPEKGDDLLAEMKENEGRQSSYYSDY